MDIVAQCFYRRTPDWAGIHIVLRASDWVRSFALAHRFEILEMGWRGLSYLAGHLKYGRPQALSIRILCPDAIAGRIVQRGLLSI